MTAQVLWCLGCVVQEDQDVAIRLGEATQDFCSHTENAYFVPHVAAAIDKAAATFKGNLPQTIYISGSYTPAGELVELLVHIGEIP